MSGQSICTVIFFLWLLRGLHTVKALVPVYKALLSFVLWIPLLSAALLARPESSRVVSSVLKALLPSPGAVGLVLPKFLFANLSMI